MIQGNELSFTPLEPDVDEVSEEMKSTAIEYVTMLNKTDKDKFFEGLELIWQGYQSVDNVKTKHQKALQRQANNPTEDETLDAGIDAIQDFIDINKDK